MMQRILALALGLVVFGACASSTTDGGSRTDFLRCDSTDDCDEGSCIEGACDPTVQPNTQALALTGSSCSETADCAGLLCDPTHKVCVADCRDAARSCLAPSVCTASEDSETYECRHLSTALACGGTPPGQDVPFTPTRMDGSGPVLHWPNPDDCIAVSYDPSLSGSAELIEQATRAWAEIACSNLCLSAPEQNAAAPDVLRHERRIHFETNALDGFDTPTLATAYFDARDGSKISALLQITSDATLREQFTLDEYLNLLGYAVGLGTAPGVDSVMSLTNFAPDLNRFNAPTARDVQALCRLYGEDPHCE